MTDSTWLQGLCDGNSAAFERCWKEYFLKIVRLAKNRMGHLRLRAVDEEDIAVSAMHSFYQMARNRKERIADHDELWRLLATITKRKISKEQQRQQAGKRRENMLAGESIFNANPGESSNGLAMLSGREPSPDLVREFVETLERLLTLPDVGELVQFKLEGYTNTEIAEKLGCSTRTVQRTIEKIRKEWEGWECCFYRELDEQTL